MRLPVLARKVGVDEHFLVLLRCSVVHPYDEEVGGYFLVCLAFNNEVRNELALLCLPHHAMGPVRAVAEDFVPDHGRALVGHHVGEEAGQAPDLHVGPHCTAHKLGESVLCEVYVRGMLVLEPRNPLDFCRRKEEPIFQQQSGEDPTNALYPERLRYPVDACNVRVGFHLRHLPNHLLRRLVDALQDCTASLVVILVLKVVAIHPTNPLHCVLEKVGLPVSDEVLHLGNVDHGERVHVAVRLLLDGHGRGYLYHALVRQLGRHVPLRARKSCRVIPPVPQESVESLEFGVDLLAIR
mmetsp:Transcript_124937/g.347859  ORF Transcript_124937/g.347859 Transcript_124937/m.347859 type:complete len:296 (+) Transcript_124937:292-1179(+)